MVKKARAGRNPAKAGPKPARRSGEKKRPDRVTRALEAALREHRGEKLTLPQQRDLDWYRRGQRSAAAAAMLKEIPKGLYCELASRQHKLIDDAAERYDLPIDGPTVNLFEAIKSLHDLIAANARFIRPADDADAIESDELELEGQSFQVLQLMKLQQEVQKLKHGNARLQIAVTRDRGDAIDRRELRDMLTWFSTRIEGLGQQLRRSGGGEDAAKCLNEFLDALASETERGVLET